MARRDLVVVGASAGGVEALRTVVAGLPAELAAAVLVVLHIPPRAPSALPGILTRSGPLKAVHAAGGERLHHGRIYVAPSDRHLLVRDGHIWLSNGPNETVIGRPLTRCSGRPRMHTDRERSEWCSPVLATTVPPVCRPSSRVVVSRSCKTLPMHFTPTGAASATPGRGKA
jgi:hypothetical protein